MKNNKKIVTLGMAITLMGGTMAYAEEAVVVNEIETTVAMEEIVDAVETASQFTFQTGIISDITINDNGEYDIFMENETGGLRFLLTPGTIITDLATNNLILAEDLAPEMEVTVIYDKNAPMGMSFPAYLGQVTAVVANPAEGNFTVGYFDTDLTNMDAMLALNIDENTNIQNVQGTRMMLTAEDVKETEALVFYGATTRSIPAQTTPDFILILDTPDFSETAVDEDNLEAGIMPIEDDMANDAVVVAEPSAVAELVPLRATATDLGFTVVWQGKDMPILMESDEYTFSIEIGSNKYLLNDEEMTASAPATLVDGVMFLDKDILG